MSGVMEAFGFFANYPLAIVISILVIVCGLIWFFKLRPAEKEKALAVEKEKISVDRERNKVTESLVQVINNQRISQAEQSGSYEKLVEYNTRITENNTVAMQGVLREMEVYTQTLAEKIKQEESNQKVNAESLKEILSMLHDLKLTLELIKTKLEK